MMIKEDKRQATYELWFLGDVLNSRVKCRDSFNELLAEAKELIALGRAEGLTVGGVEIICVSADSTECKTVWDFNLAEKDNR
tara:strand:- start:180 stop:425 length:246 start_codon:yes stop_codon:yes gene_type:complete